MKTEDQQIGAELEKARKRLLDLTLRNKLLNFNPTKRTTVQVVHELPDEVFEQLVVDQTQMLFKPAQKRSDTEGDGTQVDKEQIAFDERTQKDKHIQTDLTPAALEQRLLQIKQKSDTVFEEQGYTVLFLAVGFLEWKERQDTDTVHRAPLVLIPVMIERPTVGSAFRVKWTEEDLATNVSLQAKLEEIGIKFPDFELPDEPHGALTAYYQKVRRAIGKRDGWQVTDEIHLGFFSFNKFVMWRDLTPQDKNKLAWITGHSLLRSLFTGDKGESGSDGLSFAGFAEDEKQVATLPVRDQFHVMDADASQVTVIESAKKGKNLVVEGPPGTGKSQTITNIIAELLALGRKVLFVSEKMAALEVVKDRLDKCGLGDACLELHSRHSNKRLVLEELERTIKARPPAPAQGERKIEDRERLAVELNSYAEVLRTEVGGMKRTPFSLFGQYVRARQEIEKRGHKVWHEKVDHVDQLTETEYESGKRRLNDLAEVISVLRPISQNPWRHCKTSGSVFDSDREDVSRLIQSSLESITGLHRTLDALNEVAGTGTAHSREECRNAINAANCMADAPHVEAELLLDDRWNSVPSDSEQLLHHLKLLQDRITALEGRWSIPFAAQAVSRFSNELAACKDLLQKLGASCSTLSELAGCFTPSTLEATTHAIAAAKTVSNGLPLCVYNSWTLSHA